MTDSGTKCAWVCKAVQIHVYNNRRCLFVYVPQVPGSVKNPLISYEVLTGKGDNMCVKIVKEEYFTFVRYSSLTIFTWGPNL